MTRALLVLLVATSAHANVWQRAIDQGKSDPANDLYNARLKAADDLAEQANTHNISLASMRKLVQMAADSYREASQAKPDEPEPYYRLGRLIYSFYFDCTPGAISVGSASPLCDRGVGFFDMKRAQQVIDAWDAFEARAPLDPRFSVMLGDSEILFHRAILHTRMATKDHLEAAAKDYEKILRRSDTGADGRDETVLANLAETYMMLDRLDDAIDTYREALRTNQHTETIYGLAVALDRDERTAQAKDLIQSQGEMSLENFHRRVTIERVTFFVPAGEEYYYFALLAESFDHVDDAIRYWNEYIKSGAHPEFQPRAKQHLDALKAKQRRANNPLTPPWDELLHP